MCSWSVIAPPGAVAKKRPSDKEIKEFPTEIEDRSVHWELHDTAIYVSSRPELLQTAIDSVATRGVLRQSAAATEEIGCRISIGNPRFDDPMPAPGVKGANVKVTFSTKGTESTQEYLTDQDGRYTIRVPMELKHEKNLQVSIQVSHSLYVPRTVGPIPIADFQLQAIDEFEPNAAARERDRPAIHETSLRRVRRFKGRVLSAKGNPIEGASIVTTRQKSPNDGCKRHPTITPTLRRKSVMPTEDFRFTVTITLS